MTELEDLRIEAVACDRLATLSYTQTISHVDSWHVLALRAMVGMVKC